MTEWQDIETFPLKWGSLEFVLVWLKESRAPAVAGWLDDEGKWVTPDDCELVGTPIYWAPINAPKGA